MLPQHVLYYGVDAPLPERVPLRAGPLSLVYEEGDLRYISLGEREILRRVYVAVRDQVWLTVPVVLSNVQIDKGDDYFRISYDAQNKQGNIDFAWKGTTSGNAQGTIVFTMDGVARSTFLRNRIGFCILHPLKECSGHPCLVEHTDGRVERGVFPVYVSPNAPFVDMQAIAHEVLPGVWVNVRFSGDVFEMEDQRNWTDASYKTFCTPLRLPRPVQIDAGTRISQSVTVTLKGLVAARRVVAPVKKVSLAIGESVSGRLPRLGLGTASHGQPLTDREIARLRRLHLNHLRVDLKLAQSNYVDVLQRSASEARRLGVGLEVAVFLSGAESEQLAKLRAEVERIRPPVWAWLLFHDGEAVTNERWVALGREILGGYQPRVLVGGGTNSDFSYLNRNRPPRSGFDLVAYPIHPQEHAFDNSSLIENLEAQAASVLSARQFTDSPLAISPLTLKRRWNPNARAPEPDPAPAELPPQVDRRQMSLFAAAWTVGSIKYLAEGGVYSATYYETTGWRGVMEREDGSPLPQLFRSLPGCVFPLYHVLADVGEFSGAEVLAATSSHTLLVDSLALRKGDRRRLLAANMTPETLSCTLHNLGSRLVLRRLDENSAVQAMCSPDDFRSQGGDVVSSVDGIIELALLPYAVVRLDW